MHPSKRKGNSFEREVVSILKAYGIEAERVPLSGSCGGSHTGDIDIAIGCYGLKAECKRRAKGFARLYQWLAENSLLIVRDDHCEPLVVMRLADFARLASQSL
jgi:Holliday junction resolvase